MTHPNPHWHVVPTTVLTRSRLVPFTVARAVTTIVPHINVPRPRIAKTIVTKSHSPLRSPINHRPSPKPSNFPQKVSTVKAPQVNAINYGLGPKKALTFLFHVHGNPQHALKDKGVIDSGCSRHMTRNISHLFDFEEINRGYVAFGGNPKGGKITDPLGKFDGKADEGFLVGYSSMNYEPVVVGNQPNFSAGIQEHFNADKAREGNVQQYVLFPLWSTGSKDPQNTNADTTFEVKEPESEVHVSPSSSVKTKEHDDKPRKEAKGKNIRTIKEEVYVCQPLRFEDPDYPDKVYKMVKALYGLHQALRACLQVKQKQDGIFISQDKYVAEILRKFGLTDGKSASAPIDTEKPLLKDPDGKDVDVHTYRYLKGKPNLGLWYPKDSPFNLGAYSDSDYAGASLDRKSTTGGC
nr:hypothetical protein [Tanacetum cinerariifolium]